MAYCAALLIICVNPTALSMEEEAGPAALTLNASWLHTFSCITHLAIIYYRIKSTGTYAYGANIIIVRPLFTAT